MPKLGKHEPRPELEPLEDVSLLSVANELDEGHVRVGDRILTLVRREVHLPHLDEINGPSRLTRDIYESPQDAFGCHLVRF
jgi:hypothetical protein